jgi:hypothetical protein
MPRSVSALATASWTGAFNAFQCLRIGDRVEGCLRETTPRPATSVGRVSVRYYVSPLVASLPLRTCRSSAVAVFAGPLFGKQLPHHTARLSAASDPFETSGAVRPIICLTLGGAGDG